MTLPDIILLADYQAARGKPREEREAALVLSEAERILALQMQEVHKHMKADGVAR